MSTIKGIFEPFKPYVTNQLRLRKQIITNPTTVFQITDGQIANSFQTANLDSRDPNFLTYVAQKQCVIRMASGVDLLQNDPSRGIKNILEDGFELEKYTLRMGNQDETVEFLDASGLARNYVLGNQLGTSRFTYGNADFRADAKDGYGIVPPPGIIDAKIDTKSEDGSLREATVNFVAHNKRQLEVLETLYMRPGYPILLEWGWQPYLTGTFSQGVLKTNMINVENKDYSILQDFFDPDNNLNFLNRLIRRNKAITQGNYDGFIGYCKNFLFKVNEQGGYDCTTEIIAHGEILESLKQKITMVPVLSPSNIKRFASKGPEVEREVIDTFLLYLRSIKYSLDKAGDSKYIELVGSNSEIVEVLERDYTSIADDPAYDLTENPIGFAQQLAFSVWIDTHPMQGGFWNWDFQQTQIFFGINQENYDEDVTYQGFVDEDGVNIDISELNRVPGGSEGKYVLAFQDIKNIVKDVSKVSDKQLILEARGWRHIPKNLWEPGSTFGDYLVDQNDIDENARQHHLGLDSMFQGTILKEFSLHDPKVVDAAAEDGSSYKEKETSGVSKNIYVRWDLLCQIINKRIASEYKDDNPIVELTYLLPNAPTYQSGTPEDKPDTKWDGEETSYIRYSVPSARSIFPSDDAATITKHSNTRFEVDGREVIKMQPIADEREGILGFYVFADAYREGIVEKIPEGVTPDIVKYEKTTVGGAGILGRSFDHTVCLMPHQVVQMKADESGEVSNFGDGKFGLTRNFTSFNNVFCPDDSIGLVYFNLNHIIKVYEDLVLEEYKTTSSLGEERYKRRLKKEFNFHDFITTIWNDVNDACGGFYDFGLHTEHERPHVARIIDFTFSGNIEAEEKELFVFEPQSANSITRESHFQSRLDNDFASVMSIAAQAPNDITSLEAVSFKAFHKGIKSRFTDKENIDYRLETLETAKEKYLQDMKEYEEEVLSLKFYIKRMNASNYETRLISEEGNVLNVRRPISPGTAKDMASLLEEKRIDLLARHPEFGPDGQPNDGQEGRPNCGQYIDEATHYRNAIIPITTSMTLDGISGINPLNIFKIHPDKMPYGYQNRNIVFVVKKETHTITAGQDWTTDISGYLSLLDNTADGTNSNTYSINRTGGTQDDLDDIGGTTGEVMEYPPVPENDVNFGAVSDDPDFDGSATQDTPGARLSIAYNSEVGTSGAYRVYGVNATHQNDWNGNSHCGQDLHAPKGTPAYWPVTGVVVHKGTASEVSGLRSSVRRESDGLLFWGGHFDTLGDYEIGDTVSAGDFWGTVGNTGNAIGTSAHIHFNIYDESLGYCGGSIDPQPYFESVYPNLTFK